MYLLQNLYNLVKPKEKWKILVHQAEQKHLHKSKNERVQLVSIYKDEDGYWCIDYINHLQELSTLRYAQKWEADTMWREIEFLGYIPV